MSRSGRNGSAWRGTSAVSVAMSRCSIWSTISTCWRRNRERWQVHGRCSSGGERGRWPEIFDRLWLSLQERHGKQVGTREMIELLTLGKRYGWDRLQQAVEKALGLGCTDAAAVRHLLTATELSRPRNELLELNGLERYQRP